MYYDDYNNHDSSYYQELARKSRERRHRAVRAIKQSNRVDDLLLKKGIRINYAKSTDLQVVALLTTRKAFQVYKYYDYYDSQYRPTYRYQDDVDTVVGYVIKNKDSVPRRYLKATYGEDGIQYEEAFINPGEQVAITRHELYGLRLFNGSKLSLPDDTADEKELFNGCLCSIVTSGRGRHFIPYIRGIGFSLRDTFEIQRNIDDDPYNIKPEYQDKFSWLFNKKYFKNRFSEE